MADADDKKLLDADDVPMVGVPLVDVPLMDAGEAPTDGAAGSSSPDGGKPAGDSVSNAQATRKIESVEAPAGAAGSKSSAGKATASDAPATSKIDATDAPAGAASSKSSANKATGAAKAPATPAAKKPSKADDKQKRKRQRKANIAAALTVMFVALFAVAFIGVVVMLNDYADQLQISNSNANGSAQIPEEPFYLLLIGSDSREGTALYTPNNNNPSQSDAHADVITLMRIDPNERKVTLVSVPRDTVLDGQTNKISATLTSDNPNEVVAAVEDLTGVHIDGYLMTTFIPFENLVNALGGINVLVPQTVSIEDPATGKKVTVKKGRNQHLDGAQALALARSLDQYSGNKDALRQVNVRNIERAMIKAILAMNGERDAAHVLAALDDDTKKNVNLSVYSGLLMDFMEHADDVTIYDGTGTYEGSTRSSDNAWVIPEDEQAWEQLMAAVDAGKDPATVIKPPTF